MQFAILATSNPGALEVRDEPADASRARAHDHREHSESRVQPVSRCLPNVSAPDAPGGEREA